MLHGAKLTDAKPLKAQKLFETGEYQSFHLSSVILDSVSDAKARVKLVSVLANKQEITLAVLSKDQDTAKVDLYFNVTQDVKLVLKGAPKGTEVSLSGYYEPSADDMDDDMFGGGMEPEEDDDEDDEVDDLKPSDDSEDSEDSEEDKPKKKPVKATEDKKKGTEVEKLNQNLKQAQVNTQKNVNAFTVDEDDSDDEDYDEEDALEVGDLGDDDEDDDSDDEEPVVMAKKGGKKEGAAKKMVVQDSDDEEDDSDDEPVAKSKKVEKVSDDSEDNKLADDDSEESDDEGELELAKIMQEKFQAAKKQKSDQGKKGGEKEK